MSAAYELNLPLAATNEPYFSAPDDFQSHDALLCIADGAYVHQDDRRTLTPDHYFKSGAEMAALFADLPEAVENTLAIARRCVEGAFDGLKAEWGRLDFVVHAIAFSDKSELRGRYADTSRENFARTMLISCFSFTEVARAAAALMADGGSLLTLTYDGSTRVMPNYNVMGVAKAALEASVRYLAADFGQSGIRVNAVSAGPIRTLAGAGVADARLMFGYHRTNAPLSHDISTIDVGGAALYLLSDLSQAVTGEIHYVDCGYNVVAMPRLEQLKAQNAAAPEDDAQ